MGYNYLKKQGSDFNSGDKTLKEQLLEISFNTLKRIKIFSLLVRFFVSLLLFVIIAFDIYLGVYDVQHSYVLITILTIYTSTVIYLLHRVKNTFDITLLHSNIDIIYVTLEILAVYFSIIFFPTHPANMYTNSLKSFWFTLIVLSVFTGKWYYGFYSGFLVALLNASFLFNYENVKRMFFEKGLNLENILPSFQVVISSIYYFITGAFISFPFYLFEKQQSLALGARTENIIARPYYELSMKDKDKLVGEYLVTKIITSADIVGADYVALKESVNENDTYGLLIVGDTIGHGLNRSPGAIITMAAFMADLTNDVLKIQESINSVLYKIDKDSGGKTYCLSLALKKDGIIEYAGKAESFKLIKNGKSIDLKQNGEILGIENKLTYTMKNVIKLAYNDMLIIQTDGVAFENEEDDKTIVMISRQNYLS